VENPELYEDNLCSDRRWIKKQLTNYKAITAEMTLPTQIFIHGEMGSAVAGKTFDTVDPASRWVLAALPFCDAADVEAAVTFTGSTAAGRRFLEYSAQPNMKEVCLEVGGKSAAVGLEAATSIAKNAELQANAILWNMGKIAQPIARLSCTAHSMRRWCTNWQSKPHQWLLGDPLNPDT
jgi:acyl-CoA reductase-like NAD-dependent aldehyde dehydrogenase